MTEEPNHATGPIGPDMDLAEQIRRLGAHAERVTPPTPAAAAITAAQATSGPPLDLDSARAADVGSPHGHRSSRGIRRPKALVAAAAVLLMLGGVAGLLVSRSEVEPTQLSMQPTAALAQSATGQGRFISGQNPPDDGPSPIPPANEAWRELRYCESTGQYDIDTGNTFYGAYQFTSETWRLMVDQFALADDATLKPALAPPYVQDTLASELYLVRGAKPWPVCGRFLGTDQAMVNPLVPYWPGTNRPSETIVFLNPDATAEHQAHVRARIDAALSPDGPDPIFVTKAEALREFQALFAGNPQLADSVTEADMPPSFRISSTGFKPINAGLLENLPGVFQVVAAPAAPWKIDIPELDLSVGTEPLTTVDALFSTIAAVAPVGWGPVDSNVTSTSPFPPAGPLVLVSAMPDWDLESLEIGDAITLEIATDRRRGVSAIVRLQVASLATSLAVGDVQDPASLNHGDVVLIAPDPDDPARRLFVGTSPMPFETSDN